MTESRVEEVPADKVLGNEVPADDVLKSDPSLHMVRGGRPAHCRVACLRPASACMCPNPSPEGLGVAGGRRACTPSPSDDRREGSPCKPHTSHTPTTSKRSR